MPESAPNRNLICKHCNSGDIYGAICGDCGRKVPVRTHLDNPFLSFEAATIVLHATLTQFHDDPSKFGKRFYIPTFYCNETVCCGQYYYTKRDVEFSYQKMIWSNKGALIGPASRSLIGLLLRGGPVATSPILSGYKKGQWAHQGVANMYSLAKAMTHYMAVNACEEEMGPASHGTVLAISEHEFDPMGCGEFRITLPYANTARIEARRMNNYRGYLIAVDGTAESFDPAQPIDHWMKSELTRVCDDIDLSHLPSEDNPTGVVFHNNPLSDSGAI